MWEFYLVNSLTNKQKTEREEKQQHTHFLYGTYKQMQVFNIMSSTVNINVFIVIHCSSADQYPYISQAARIQRYHPSTV